MIAHPVEISTSMLETRIELSSTCINGDINTV